MKREDRKLFSHRFREESIFVHTTDEDINPWDRTRIVAVLVNETGIDYGLADKISEEIQEIIFSSGLQVVTSELVRELVNAKLVEHRFEKARERNRRLGLSLYDVGGLVRYASSRQGAFPTPAASDATMAEALKRQYALADVIPSHLHRFHLEGRFHIHGLPAPDRVLTATVNGSVLLSLQRVFGNCVLRLPDSPEALFRNWIRADTLLRSCVHEVIIWTGMEEAFHRMGAQPEETGAWISEWVATRGAMDQTPGMSRSGVHLSERETVEAVIDRMEREWVWTVPVSAEPDAWVPGPWIERHPGMPRDTRFVMEAVTLNLPGLGIRSIVEDIPVETELKHLLDKTLSVFAARRLFMEKLASVRPEGVLDVLTAFGFSPLSAVHVVGICGLNEWCRVLLNGDLDEEESRMDRALEFLERLAAHVNELSRRRRMDVRLGSVDQSESAYRFARLDLKFQPYYASRILNGNIASGAVYYSRDATLVSNKPVPLERKVALESIFQRLMDLPFSTIIRKTDLSLQKGDKSATHFHRLSLTSDFSFCYNCHTMDSGVYRTCPTCHSADITILYKVNYGYDPVSVLMPSVREELVQAYYY